MKQIKRILLRYIVRDLLKGVTVDDLLRVENGKVFVGKQQLSEEEVVKLKTEISTFNRSYLWRLMSNNIYWIANYKMIHGASKESDMDMGRAMTKCIDTLQEFIDKAEEL